MTHHQPPIPTSRAGKPQRARAAWGLVLAAALPACAGAKPPLTAPADGGPAWVELTSKHFILETDGDLEDARRALADLEQMEALVADVGLPPARGRKATETKIEVVIFRGRESYLSLGHTNFSGYFHHETAAEPEAPPRAVLYGNFDVVTRQGMQQLLALAHVRDAFGYTPPWLRIGLAEYYSTLRADAGKAIVGDPVRTRGFTKQARWGHEKRDGYTQDLVPVGSVPAVKSLVALEDAAFFVGEEFDVDLSRAQAANYAGAWALIHMLSNGAPKWRERFGRFSEAVQRATPWRSAWADAFGDVPPEELEDAYRTYLVRLDTTVRTTAYTLPPPAPPTGERPMTDAEVHILWAKLFWDRASTLPKAEAQLDAAARSDPSAARLPLSRGLLRMKQHRLDLAAPELEAAVAKSPKEAAALAALLRVKDAAKATEKERGELVERLEAAATTALSFELVARERLRLKQPRSALSAAKRAADLDPACAGCFDAWASVAAALGDNAKAVELERHAVDIAADGKQKAALSARLEKLQGAPAPSPPAAPAGEKPAPAPQ